MLGGVYAGRADDLSLATTMPALAAACRREHTLTGAVRAALARGPAGGMHAPGPAGGMNVPGPAGGMNVPGPAGGAVAGRPAGAGPIFGTLVGGVGRLVAAVAERVASADIRLGLPVRSITREGATWRVTVGSTREPVTIEADAVVVATPAAPAARLLSDVEPKAAELVGALAYASLALVTFALPEVDLPELSGFLVPATEGYAVKAATFFDRKWAHLRRPGVTLVRTSLGRYGDERVLRRDDESLAALAHAELGPLLGGGALPAPVETRVQRWGGALPQYTPGHLDRTAAVRAMLPATVAVAGAAYDGVGIPACVRSGWSAADRVVQGLRV
jgi:oxygen-dependent protoporphyrinogen oxidase